MIHVINFFSGYVYLQTAFQKGRYIEQKNNPNEYLQYFATLDGRETPLCHSLDGKVFKKNDPFWETYYPPNHFNCRSTTISLSKNEVEAERLQIEKSGKEYLEKEQKANPKLSFKPGSGFSNSPEKGLSSWIGQKCKEHNIENVKEAVPKFKTLRELNEWANNQDFANNVKFSGVPVNVAKEWLDSFEANYKLFPELRSKIQFTGTIQERNKLLKKEYFNYYWGMIKEVYNLPDNTNIKPYIDRINALVKKSVQNVPQNVVAVSNSTLDDYNCSGISLNKNLAKNIEDLKRSMKYSVDTKFHPIGTESIKATVDHEFGHQIDNLINFRNSQKFLEYYNNIDKLSTKENLSVYALKSEAEFIAEAWSEFMNNPNPRQIALDIGNMLIEEYKKWKNQ